VQRYFLVITIIYMDGLVASLVQISAG